MEGTTFDIIIFTVVCVGWVLTYILFYFLARRGGARRSFACHIAAGESGLLWVIISLIGLIFFNWHFGVLLSAGIIFLLSIIGLLE